MGLGKSHPAPKNLDLIPLSSSRVAVGRLQAGVGMGMAEAGRGNGMGHPGLGSSN